MSEAYLDYYYGDESQQFRFLMIPMELYDNPVYDDVDGAAPAVYAAMLSRIRLSKKNGWIDSKNRVYIKFTLKDVMKYGKCKRDKARKIIEELETCVPGGLIERDNERQIIFVKNFQHKEIRKSDNGKSNPEKKHSVDKKFSGVGNSPGGSESSNEVDRQIHSEWVGNTNRSNIDLKYNKTDLDNPIHLSFGNGYDPSLEINTKEDGEIDRNKVYEKIIKENIAYDKCMHDLKSVEKDLFLTIYKVICDVVTVPRDNIKINGADRPYETIKSIFLKLNNDHVMYVIYKIIREKPDMRLPQNYIRTCLYDAYISADAGYSMAVYGGMAI